MTANELFPVNDEIAAKVLQLLAIARDLTVELDDFNAHGLTCALMEDLCVRWNQPLWPWVDDEDRHVGKWLN